jgi:hypothetical protein
MSRDSEVWFRLVGRDSSVLQFRGLVDGDLVLLLFQKSVAPKLLT